MKRLTFILIFALSLFAGKVVGQCVTIRTITGPTQVCAGSIGNVYITESGMTGYVWTVSTGGTITEGTGTNSITVTWNTTGPETISVNYTDTFGCIATSPTVFNVLVNQLLPISVFVDVSTNQICAGTSVTFTATPTNGGVTPAYQWKNGGIDIPGETGSTYTTTTLANGNIVTVVMTSSLTCVSGNPATSNPITMNVTTALPVSVSIAASPSGAICAGTSVTFTATPTNGGTPSYQWKLNGSNDGSNSPSFTSTTLADNDIVTVVMTSSLTCVSGNPATSNPITMNVTTALPVSVSIAASPAGAICAGTSVTFTATPANGGTPAYQWKVNGSNRGTNSPNFTTATLADNDVVTVVMTSSLTCISGNPATSNPITMNVTTPLPVSVRIAALPAGKVCSGTSVTFTATPTNGGAPSYQWKLNGSNVGSNSPSFTSTTLADNDIVTVVMTSSLTCATGNPATSNPITMNVTTALPVSVSIAASPSGTICAGTSVTFTATPTNGGAPSYQWKLNGSNVGSNSPSFTSTTLADNDIATVVMTSSLTCVSGNPATSNPITMSVNTALPVSVSIAASPSGAICAGTSVTFTATPANGGTPAYQWKVNGSNRGTNSPNFTTATLADNDVVTVVMTSSLTCISGNPATSNPIKMNVTTPLPVSVRIAALPAGKVCSGTSVTFTATPTNGGAPSYQWKLNGSNVGSNSPSFTSTTLADNDIVTVVMTSSLTCATGNPATSNPITMNVTTALPVSVSIAASPSGAICAGTSVTFTATPTNGGTPSYQWKLNGSNVGSNSPSFTSTTLADNDIVTVVMMSSLTCVSGNPATSNPITMNVTTALPVSVSISASPSGAICAGTSVTFTAIPANGGIPSYQWNLNGSNVGTNSPSFTPATLVNNDAIHVVMTSSLICVTGNPSTSNTITMTVTPQPFATISYTGSPWCGSAGFQSVTLTGTTGGTFSALPSGLSINPSTGEINPAASSANTYTVTYTIPASGGCGLSTSNVLVTISPTPTAPVVGAITQPTCSVATGSVALSGLPSGNWILTRNPGNVTTAGTGATFTVSLLATGTYTFTVTNSAGCVSPPTGNVVINAQPASPAAPLQSVDCSLGFGKAVVTVTSPIGAGLEYSLDGGIPQASPVFSPVNNGPHSLSVTNAAGCTKVGLPFTVTCGCINPPTVTLTSNSGNTCGTTAVTVTENTFGGTATNVTLTSNGGGVLNPLSSAVSPFSFTYTPVAADGGKNVIITVTTDNPQGAPCLAGVATYTLTVDATPATPVVGTITNPTCLVATGSVVLNGLPAAGTWTLTRNPGGIITNGTGTSTTVSGLAPGTYSFTVTNSQGCISPSSANVVIVPPPSSPTPPVVGAITQPTCASSTGTVVLSGLPSPGNWTLTRNPGGVTVSGSGTTTTVSTLPSGTYTFSVTNATGCISSPSGNVVINAQPTIPPAPTVGTITPPGCILATGSVLLSGLPGTGTWTLIRYPGTVSTTGTGTTTTLSGLPTGTYNFTVTTAEGCLSVPSANVVIPVQPATPAAPVIGTITQPTLAIPSGSVELSGLPAPGAWIITLFPDSLTTPGSGTSKTITNLPGGVFTFTVTNSSGCRSAESAQVVISTPGVPDLIITNPAPACSPGTVDITSSSITEGSTPGLTLTYWTDLEATIPYSTPTTATAGTYYIKGTTVSGYFKIEPVVVTIDTLPVPNGGPDQTLYYQYSTTLDATLGPNETGIWSLISGSGTFSNSADPASSISGLSLGENVLLWSVKTAVCPEVSDTVKILVDNLIIPTLITPNMDGRNDYFVVKGLTSLGKTELFIFDRRGVQVYKNLDYDNSWDGIDYNKNPLPDDTYFYVIKPTNGKSLSGYIVIRR